LHQKVTNYESYWKLKVENGGGKLEGEVIKVEIGSWNLKFKI